MLPPPPGTDAEIAEAERFGRIILVHDAAAAQATDELIRIGATPTNQTGVLGWITVPSSEGLIVRFVGNVSGRYAALYDVTFSPVGTPSAKHLTPPEPLPPLQSAAFEARQLAIASTSLDCSDRYNTVVFQDPVGNDDWYVYLLPATTATGRVMVGREVRVLVSSAGKRVLESRALSKDCMYIDRSAVPAGAKEEALLVTNLLTPTPNESHVFLSLHEGLPFAVGTSLGAWMVTDGKIRYLGPTNGKHD
ncbi:MAG: hypothetical protein U0587_10470 [Candidatus Binatia bacterium]